MTRRWPALALPLLLSAPPALGEEPVRAEPIRVEGERPEAEVFEEAPIEKQVISAEEIAELPVANAAEVVSRLPGFRTQTRVQGEQAAVSIEGMPPEYTLILVDGQRYTGRIGETADLRDVPVANVERIEVLRGAQALRYGSEAAGGVINVVTRRPETSGWSSDLDVGAGDGGRVLGSGTLGARFGDASATLRVLHDQIDGFDSRGAGVFPGSGGADSRQRIRDVYGTFDASPAPELELFSRLGWRREDEDLVPEEEAAEDADRTFERALGGGGFRWHLGETTSLHGEMQYFRGVTESTAGRPFRLAETEPRVDLRVEQYVPTGPLDHVLSLAVDARRPTLDLREEGEVLFPDPALGAAEDVGEHWTRVGTTLQLDTSWGEWASLTGGVRHEHHTAFDDRLVPQVALLLKPAAWARMRLSWGEVYRTPSLQDLFQPPAAQLGGAYFLAGNPNLVPESGTQYRAGIELVGQEGWGLAGGLSFAVTGFWNELDDLIRSSLDGQVVVGFEEFRTTPNLPICAIVPSLPQCQERVERSPITAPLFRQTNLDEVRTRGVEAKLRFRPNGYVDLSAGYTFLDTDVATADRPELVRLPNEPRHTVDLSARLRAPQVGTTFSVLARWRGRAPTETSGTGLISFADTEAFSDPSWIVDVRVGQPLLDGAFEVYADVRNLTDQAAVDSYDVRPRTFFVGVRARFSGAW